MPPEGYYRKKFNEIQAILCTIQTGSKANPIYCSRILAHKKLEAVIQFPN